MANPQELAKLRPLGKLEQISAACHHLGFFNNAGLSAHYNLTRPLSQGSFDLRHHVYAATRDVARKHRILFAIPVNEDATDTYFASLTQIDLTRSITFLKRSEPLANATDGKDEELDAVLANEHNTNFKAEYGTLPFWRLIILEDVEPGKGFTASFIYHHAIGDGVAGLVFHNAFLGALEAVSASVALSETKTEAIIVPNEETSLLPPLEELHPLPIDPTPATAPATALQQWTGNPIRAPSLSGWMSLQLSPGASQAFFQACKERDLSVTPGLSSVIATILFGILPPTAEAITCIVPVSLRPWLGLPLDDANAVVGTYFDATRVQFKRPGGNTRAADASDVWAGAQDVSIAISRYLENVSPSGEPYTSVAPFKAIENLIPIFQSLIGNPRDAGLEVTNVGRLPPPVALEGDDVREWQVGKVMLSRSAVASGAAVTVSVATGGDGSMTIGFSWQEGVVEKDVISKLRDGVQAHFEKYELVQR